MWTTLLLLAAAPITAEPSSVFAGVMSQASRDMRTLPTSDQRHARYLWLPKGDKKARAVLTYHVNALSRDPTPTAPVAVGADLYRILLTSYAGEDGKGWKAETWEKLAAVEPYFTVRLTTKEIVWHGGFCPTYGVYMEPGRYRVEKTVNAVAPWVYGTEAEKSAVVELVTATQSVVPVVRADWFLVQTAVQQNRVAGYYDFLGLKTRDDYFDLIGADAEKARKRGVYGAIIARSERVALNNRHLRREDAFGGFHWFSEDVTSNTGKKNAVNTPDGLDVEAYERIGLLPNGLPVYFLDAANGDRQDVAPGNIANNTLATDPDTQVHVNLRCIDCHGADGGVLHGFKDWARRALNRKLLLTSTDPQKAIRLRQLYERDVLGKFVADNKAFDLAVQQAAGLSSFKELAQAYAQTFDAYQHADVTLEQAADELGCTPKELAAAVERERAARGILPLNVLGNWLGAEPEPLRREHFEEAVPLLMTWLRGYSAIEGQ